jgi:hypothetical protein
MSHIKINAAALNIMHQQQASNTTKVQDVRYHQQTVAPLLHATFDTVHVFFHEYLAVFITGL